jgi:hypothetical protein
MLYFKLFLLIINCVYFYFQSLCGQYIEIIIPGTKYYSMYDLLYKSEAELWDIKNVAHLHKNMENRLGLSIVIPGMQELNEKNIIDKYKNKFLKYKTHNCPDTLYFFFNWPGKKTNLHRKYAALRLYIEIKKLKKIYPDKEISILAHSHGGNVALEMTYWAHLLRDENFFIEELYLFGTPIGKKTEQWAVQKNHEHDYMFEKIINCYHKQDLLQVIDVGFDIACKKKLEINRCDLHNQESNFTIKDNRFFYNFYLYHTHFFTVDFLCDTFLKMKDTYRKKSNRE